MPASEPKKLPGIFISYRRSDNPDAVGRIYDRLVSEFGKARVFKDVEPAGSPAATDAVLTVLKRPSGFAPLLMSLAAMATIVIHVSRYGTEPQPDEGAAAHIWQLLMVLDGLAIGYFAIAVVPRAPRAGGIVLALQITAMVAAAAPIFILGF